MSGDPSARETDPVVSAMRLRPAPPKVMRLSRKALLVAGGVVGCACAGLLLFALREPDGVAGAQADLYRPAGPPPETVNALPADYTGPRLGPPLPGDLGRPILNAQCEDDPRVEADAWEAQSTVQDAAAQARRQAIEQARQEQDTALTSALFVTGGRAGRDEPVVEAEPATSISSNGTTAPGDLWAGTIIPGALVTGLRSDLPGPVLGRVTEDVRDSRTGRAIIIPKGTRLIGEAGGETADGQSRIRIVWSRLVLPDGRSRALQNAQASDAQGFAGLEDRVDNRWGERWRVAGLTTLLSISTAAADGDEDDRLIRALRDGAGSGADQVGRGILDRGLSVPPRLTVRPGFVFRIILTEDLDLAPIEGD